MILVGIPCYNSEKSIRKCVQSIELQQFVDFKILLSIDGDGKLDKYKELLSDYNNIEYIYNPTNEGISNNQNRIIEYAIDNNYDSLTFIDHDDMLDSFTALFDLQNALGDTYVISNARAVYNHCNVVNPVTDICNYLSTHGHLYSVKFLKDNNIRFIPNTTYDQDIMLGIMLHKYKFNTLSEFTYIWNLYENSTSHIDVVESKRILESCKKIDKYNTSIETLCCLIIRLLGVYVCSRSIDLLNYIKDLYKYVMNLMNVRPIMNTILNNLRDLTVISDSDARLYIDTIIKEVEESA